MGVTIFHNPACATSRNTLALIRHAGIEPVVIQGHRSAPRRSQSPAEGASGRA